MFGTVHTFQGKEAPYVIFLLGGDPKKPGLISSFAGAKPNLVNVAVTRAKHRLYVIGDRGFWTGIGDTHRYFSTLADHLPSLPSVLRFDRGAALRPGTLHWQSQVDVVVLEQVIWFEVFRRREAPGR